MYTLSLILSSVSSLSNCYISFHSLFSTLIDTSTRSSTVLGFTITDLSSPSHQQWWWDLASKMRAGLCTCMCTHIHICIPAYTWKYFAARRVADASERIRERERDALAQARVPRGTNSQRYLGALSRLPSYFQNTLFRAADCTYRNKSARLSR